MNLSYLNSIIEGILQYEDELCPEGYTKMGKIVEDEMMIYKNTMAEVILVST
jgi:hypothetical protein